MSLALWIGSGAFGLFMSSVFPSTLSMAEHYIDVTGKKVGKLSQGPERNTN